MNSKVLQRFTGLICIKQPFRCAPGTERGRSLLQHARKLYVRLCLCVCLRICASVEPCAVPSWSHPLQLGTSTPKLTMELPNPFNSPSDGTEGGLNTIGTVFLFSRRIAIVTLHLNSGISISWRHAPLHRNCMGKAVLAQRGRDGQRERLPRLRRKKRHYLVFMSVGSFFFKEIFSSKVLE